MGFIAFEMYDPLYDVVDSSWMELIGVSTVIPKVSGL
jgi:hypothetical protein